jgi:endoglucanase
MTAQTVLPRWRGFNLLEMFTADRRPHLLDGTADFREDDFRWMTEWGFDFARIPMDYRLLIEDDDLTRYPEALWEKVDRVVRLGEQYDVHISLNLHRAPGYCVNPPEEALNLWQDDAALDAFCNLWAAFARRYRGIPSARLSFDLVNEPPAVGLRGMDGIERYVRVCRAASAAVRAADPDRLIIADGTGYGNYAHPELADLKIAQSCRAYFPMAISHHRAHWAQYSPDWPDPAWPLQNASEQYAPRDRAELQAHYEQWAALARMGIGVHCGEGGAWRYTPHDVVLAWLGDVLDILKELNIGWALWNLRGQFGLVNSERADVAYADWHGHQLDRALLDLLRAH